MEKREYNKIKNDFPMYMGKVFTERMKELGMTRYRFLKDFPSSVSRYTLDRTLVGSHSTNVTTMAEIAERLGLEIVIRPKEK